MGWQCTIENGAINVCEDDQCIGQYILIKKPYCDKCATTGVDFNSCQRIHNLDWFDCVRTVGIYYQKHLQINELLSQHILRFKSDPSFKEPLGKSMGLVAKNVYPELLCVDGIVPVPLHIDELKRRGFNQSRLLADQLSQEIGIPVIDVLAKNAEKSMQGRGFLDRYHEVEGLYQANNSYMIKGKDLMIVDDVRASGATCSESAKMLKSAGAKSVKVFVLGATKYSKGK